MTRQITLYSLPNCSQCRMTHRWLNKAGVDYSTVDLSESPDDAAAIKELGYLEAPVIIISTGDAEADIHWGGFNPDFLNTYVGAVA